MTRRLLLALAATTAPAFAQTVPPTPPVRIEVTELESGGGRGVDSEVLKLALRRHYGPSWERDVRALSEAEELISRKPRPEKVERDATAVGVGRSGPPVGVAVLLWGDVAAVKPLNKYELRYRVRVHTKAGEVGPLVGPPDRPNCVAADTALDTGWNGLEGQVDITRKELTEFATLPPPSNGALSHTVLLRVEPVLYDATADKPVSPRRTTAVVLAATVTAKGEVWEVRTLGDWLAAVTPATADDALAVVATLDEYDPTASGLEAGILKVLGEKGMKSEQKAKFIAAIPADRLQRTQNEVLRRALEGYARGTDDTLKTAAVKKLAEK